MTMFVLSPIWIFFAIGVLMVIATSAARRRRLMDRRFDVKVCGHCGASQPSHATFCRQCGQRIG